MPHAEAGAEAMGDVGLRLGGGSLNALWADRDSVQGAVTPFALLA